MALAECAQSTNGAVQGFLADTADPDGSFSPIVRKWILSQEKGHDDESEESERIRIGPLPTDCTKLNVLNFLMPHLKTPALAIRFHDEQYHFGHPLWGQIAIVVLGNAQEAATCVSELNGRALCGQIVSVRMYSGDHCKDFAAERMARRAKEIEQRNKSAISLAIHRMEEAKRAEMGEEQYSVMVVQQKRAIKKRLRSIKRKIKVAAHRVEQFKETTTRGLPTQKALELIKLEATIRSSRPNKTDRKRLIKAALTKKAKEERKNNAKAKRIKKSVANFRKMEAERKQNEHRNSQYEIHKRASQRRRENPTELWPRDKNDKGRKGKKGRKRKKR